VKRRRPRRSVGGAGPAAPVRDVAVPAEPAGAPGNRAGAAFWLGLVLVLLTAGVFSPVARNDFISMDDKIFIYDNATIRQGLNPATARWALFATENWNWYPVARLSHLLDVNLFGLRAGGHHLASLGWHAAAALLLFTALRLATGALRGSFAAAGLFAWHPLQVESVAWAAERSMVLSGFFCALTLWLWVRHVRRPSPASYSAALAAFALGLAAKPTLVTLPFALLLLDFWPLGRFRAAGPTPWRADPSLLGRRLLEKTPFFLLSAASSALTLATQEQGGAMGALAARLPIAVRLGNAALSYWRYLGKIFWPADLAVFYPHAAGGVPLGIAAVAALTLAAATACAILLSRRRPWLGVGWLWFLGIMVPMIGLVQVGSQQMADRYAYLPSIGIFVAVIWTARAAARSRESARAVVAVIAAVTLVGLGAATAVQAARWRDSLTLYEHALRATRDNYLIENNLGNELLRQGRLQEAIPHLETAIRLNPAYADAFLNLGDALSEAGRPEEARRHLEQALSLRPNDPGAHHSLGLVLYRLGRQQESIAHLEAAVRLRPDLVEALSNLGNVLYYSGRYEEAEARYQQALRLRPDFADARRNLAVLQQVLRRGRAQGAAK